MKDKVPEDSVTANQNNEKDPFAGYREQLKNGIWPRSVPLWMTAFYIALFIIRPWEKLFPWMADIHFERTYALCMIAVVIFFREREKHFQVAFQTVTVLLFLSGVFLSYVFAINPSLAWEPFYKYLVLCVFYFILLLAIRNPYDLMFIIICYIVTMATYLAKSQWEFFIHGHHRYDMGVIRMVGIESTFGGPNNLAMSIVVSLPMALFLWLYRKELSLRWPAFEQKWFPRFLLFYFILAVSSIVLTNSRSGMVAFVFFVILSIFRRKGIGKKFGYMFLGVFILAAIWLMMPEENKGRIRTVWAPETGPANAQTSAEGRIEGYKAGMTMLNRFPITGVGIGNFNMYRMRYIDGIDLEAHNLFGQLLGETGIIGGLTFLFMIIVLLRNCKRVRVMAKSQSDQFLSLLADLAIAIRNSIFLLTFLGLFGHNLFRFNWLWLVAFCVVTTEFAMDRIRSIEEL